MPRSAGATADDTEWLRRKFNVVVASMSRPTGWCWNKTAEDAACLRRSKALDVADYALAGGGFPIPRFEGGRHWLAVIAFRPAAARGSQSRRARCCRTCGAGPGCAGAACGLKI
ncbi:heme-binding protein [Brucella abortus]|nr:heme-binding protein [Brucella abortus]